jgi:fucose permease
VLATWVSRLPATRERLHASPAQLGLVLLFAGAGSLIAMPSSGALCRRWGSRAAVAMTALPACGTLVLLAVAPSLPAMAVALFAFGGLYGAWDVSMNVHGSTVDQRSGRPWMPRYHACWSVGGITGAGLGALAARAGMPVPAHFAVAAGLAAALVVLALRLFVSDRQRAAPPDRRAGRRPPWSGLLGRRLVLVGLVTLCSVIMEGAAGDWLAIYLVSERAAPEWLGAAGYATFACAMAAGRFTGTTLIGWMGRAGAIRAGGLLGVAGIVCTVTGAWLPLAFLGAALWALGVCLIFPAAISAAGETPGRPADAIAAVSTVGYGALLVGPPVIGILADHVGLGHALLVLVPLAAAITALAPSVRPPAAAVAGRPAGPPSP